MPHVAESSPSHTVLTYSTHHLVLCISYIVFVFRISYIVYLISYFVYRISYIVYLISYIVFRISVPLRALNKYINNLMIRIFLVIFCVYIVYGGVEKQIEKTGREDNLPRLNTEG